MKQKLIIIGKSPFQAEVKTRLAKDVGAEWVGRFYPAMIRDLIHHIKDYQENFDEVIFAIDTLSEDESKFFQYLFDEVKLNATLIEQVEGSFYFKLDSLLSDYLTEEHSIVLSGTDVPDLPLAYISTLAKEDNWLGPDLDGGFYFAQLTLENKDIFKNFEPQNHETVAEELMRATSNLKAVETWSDIDTFSDLKRSVARNPGLLYHLRKELISYQVRSKLLHAEYKREI